MANLFDQANERKKWDATIAQVGQMGYPQNPAQPPAFTSPQPRHPNSFGDAAAATNNPGVTQLPNSPAQPASTSGGLNAPWWSGEYATAARLSDKSGLELEQQRAAAATPGQAPANDPVKRIINTGTLSMPQAVTKPADVAPAAPAAPNPTDQRLAAGAQQAPTPAQQPSGNSPVGMSVADAQKQGLVGERVGYDPAYDQRLTGAPGQNGAVTRNGNSYAGTNVSGDITVNGQAPGGGAVSAQNMAAADALQARQTPAGFQPAGSQQAGVQAPIVRNSTNDWAARNNLRNASVSASSITNNGGKFDRSGPGDSAAMAEYKAALATDQALQQAQPGMDQTAMRENAGIQREGMQQEGATTNWRGQQVRGQADQDGNVAAYQAALKSDLALQQAQPGMDQAAMRENAGIQREGMQQDGATTRTGMQERGSMGRTMAQAALEQQKINQAGESQGFANRAAAQSEQLRNVLLDPNATPEQRSVAQRNLAALSDNTEDARKNVVTLGGGQEWDAQAGAMRNVPQRAIDLRTGQEIGVRAESVGQGGSPYKDGQRLLGKDGKSYVVRTACLSWADYSTGVKSDQFTSCVASSCSRRQATPIITAARLLRVSTAFLAVHAAPDLKPNMPRPEPCPTALCPPGCSAMQT